MAACLVLAVGACRPEPEARDDAKNVFDAAPPIDAAGDAPDDAPVVEKVLRVATFNVRLLFDTSCDSGNCGAGDFEKAPSQAELDARADLIADAIRSLEADVVSVQEIETQTSMVALSSRLTDLYPTVLLGETGAPGSVDVAVLGAGAFLLARKHRYHPMVRPDGTSTYFAREFLEVHVELGGQRVIVFSAHFRSKANDDPGRRLAEAQAAREIVIASANEFPDAVVVLAGDLNDVPGSAPIEVLESGSELTRVAKDKPPSELEGLFGSVFTSHFLAGDAAAPFRAAAPHANRAANARPEGGDREKRYSVWACLQNRPSALAPRRPRARRG